MGNEPQRTRNFQLFPLFLHLTRFQVIFVSPQFMESGANGRLGRPAVKHAAKGRRPGDGTVSILPHPAVGQIVWALHWKKRNV